MKLGKLFGWGIVIYAIISLAWSGMSEYGWTQGLLPQLAELVVLVAVCVIAGNGLKFRTWKDILPYSIGWAVIAAVLDGIFFAPTIGWVWYADWSTWGGYALMALLPLLAPLIRRELLPHGVWET